MTERAAAWLGVWLAATLLAWLAAHVTLSARLAKRVAWWRGALALVVPPLAPAWGWRFGLRRGAQAWAIAIVAYAIGVVVAR